MVLIPFLLCWGSFLNVLSHRLIRGVDIVFQRSRCPLCQKNISWFDLIPVLSWLLLQGKCRQCRGAISALYPFIEILTPLIMIPLILWTPLRYIPAYFLFFSALIVTIRSDIEHLLISRFVTLFLIPVGLLLSSVNALPITFLDSLIGALLGYGFLLAIASLFRWITKKDGMGQGDLELLAFIGSFTGIIGCWMSLLIGSILGTLYGLLCTPLSKKTSVKIPFGPFLSFGAISYVLWQQSILNALFGF